jgi:hypothetical protein
MKPQRKPDPTKCENLRPLRPHYPAAHNLTDALSATQIAKALNGVREGKGWKAICPAHDDHNPSLSIDEGEGGKPLVKCWAGCTQDAVIAALRAKGLWSSPDHHTPVLRFKPKQTLPVEEDRDPQRIARALAIWDEAEPAAGTVVERYLTNRGLELPSLADIRCHPSLRHECGSRFPAMIGLITDCTTGELIGIHRTFLSPDGSSKAEVSKAKMMLGYSAGGVVRLAPDSSTILLGEGIETTIAGMKATQRVGWAALSTSGMKRVTLPPEVSRVIILVDGDPPGRDAADTLGRQLLRLGKHVKQVQAPDGFDFNDVLLGVTDQHANDN